MTSSEHNDIWKPEEYAAYHKMVFRIVFDFLNAHFPPEVDTAWWEKFSEDIGKASDDAKGGSLVNGMLMAVADYMEEEWRKRKKAGF